MASDMIAPLLDRGVVRVSGPDAGKLLQGIITNDVETLAAAGDALHAGLLSPQGKILFEFFVIKTDDGLLIETAAEKIGELMKRLTMYKLRADAAISDVSTDYDVFVLWGEHPSSSGETAKSVSYIDPRSPKLGRRILAETAFAADICSATNGTSVTAEDYHAHRITLGVPEGGKDYIFGDAYPHEAGFDIFGGVSFKKGCYVGQEVVARMENKSVVRKRVVPIRGIAPLQSGSDIMMGDVPIGRIGCVSGKNALAMLRLDRAVEALDYGIQLTSSGVELQADAGALENYRKAIAARPTLLGL